MKWMVHINLAAANQQFRTVLRMIHWVPKAGSWVPAHGDAWSTWVTNEIIHVTFKVPIILLRNFPQRMPQPYDTNCKNFNKKYCIVL